MSLGNYICARCTCICGSQTDLERHYKRAHGNDMPTNNSDDTLRPSNAPSSPSEQPTIREEVDNLLWHVQQAAFDQEGLADSSIAKIKDELIALYTRLITEAIGDNRELEDCDVWLERTKKYGGTAEEYWKLFTIINTENNVKDEIRTNLKRTLGDK